MRTVATRPAMLLAGALLMGSLGGCTLGAKFPDLGVPASPRVAAGKDIPKGGGVYKVGQPYSVGGRRYVPKVQPGYDRTGVASWYGSAFHGRRTANGEIYDMHALTAGHPTLPLPSYAHVTNLENGRTVLVRINDRGPYVGDRIVDLSYRTARTLGFHRQGLARVRVRYAGPAPLDGNDAEERRFLAAQPWAGSAIAAARETASPITTASIGSGADTMDAGADPAMPAWSVLSYREGLQAGGASRKASRTSATAKPATTAGTYLRVGPFASRAEAERLRHMLAAGEPSTLERRGAQDVEYDVRLGPYDDVAAAGVMARVASAGFEPRPDR